MTKEGQGKHKQKVRRSDPQTRFPIDVDKAKARSHAWKGKSDLKKSPDKPSSLFLPCRGAHNMYVEVRVAFRNRIKNALHPRIELRTGRSGGTTGLAS